MSDQITGLEKNMESKIDEKFKKVKKEILIKVNEDIDQRFEKFKRRKNIVIYGLPEGVGKEEREKHRSDDESIKELMRELRVEVERFRSIRLGKQVNVNRTRPIKIELEEERDKYKILKKAANIRNTQTAKFKKIIISADMTFKQRELDKILREELKVRRNAGESDIKIKDGRIVSGLEEGDRSRV